MVNRREKIILLGFLMFLVLEYAGAALVYRKQSLRREKEAVSWGSWRIPPYPAGKPGGVEAGSGFPEGWTPVEILPEPDAVESIRNQVRQSGMELTGLKRLYRPEGSDLIIQAQGPAGGILRFLEGLPRHLPGWCFRDLSLRRGDLIFTLDLVAGQAQAPGIPRVESGTTGSDGTSAVYLEKMLFTRYPREEKDPRGSPARLGVTAGYAPVPAWLILSGVEKSGTQGLTYLFLDSRTGRVRRIPPGGSSGDWALSPGEGGWILQAGDEAFFLGGL